jgi:hypothetical protein
MSTQIIDLLIVPAAPCVVLVLFKLYDIFVGW